MAAAKSTISSEHVGIGTALSRNRLAMPPNQREYSWEEKHVTALFQDLLRAITANKPAYFLGTIVLSINKKTDALEVVDGQQRLATTTILLGAIRDYFEEQRDSLLVNDIESRFMFTVVRETRSIQPRLTLNLADNEYFRQRILSKPGTLERAVEPTKPSHELIDEAARLAKEHVHNVIQAHTATKGRTDV